MATTPTGPDVTAADEWERRLAAERSSLRRVAAAVVTGSDPAAALSLAAEEVASLMGVEQGFVFRFESDRVIVAGVHGIERSPIGAVHEMLEDGVLPSVFRTRAAARVEGRTRPLGRQNSDQYWISPYYCGGIGAPVFVGDRLWGAVVAATTRPDPFPAGAEGRLTYFAEVAGIAIGNAEANARLAELAMTDPLTGLANHRAFHQALADEVERAQRHSRPLALAVIDVDHFKSVNDAHGHMAGDRVLIEVARRLVRASRRGDLVARVGGEEFAWLIPEADTAGALRVGERARKAVAREHFAGVGAVTVSIGVAELGPADSASALYDRADGALYAAKDAGRNRIRAHGDGEGSAGRPGSEPHTAVVVRSLGHAVSAHDPALGQRCERVAALAERMALAAGWPAGDARRLHDAALLKDVGLLGAAGAGEREDGGAAWPAHVPLGAGLAEGVLGRDQASWVRGHHERWDGGGFPEGLRGEAIPEGARLIALADAWDALGVAGDDGARSGQAAAWARIAEESGRRHCPRAVAALDAVLRQDREGAS